MSVSLVKPPLNAAVFGEGPHWEVATQSLLYVDMTDKAIHRWNAVTGIDEVVKLDIDGRPSLVIPSQSGGYVVTHGTTVSHLEWSSGTLTTLGTLDGVESEIKVTFNDGKCDSRGRLWAGTFPADVKDIMNITPNQGYLVSVARGSVQKQADKITLSNGMAWSADERTLYFIDSIPREILAFDFDVNTGKLSNRRVAVAFPPDSRETLGMPDGMTIDTDGKLWVACVMVGKVACFDPETGKMLRTIQFPVKGITSCCFGGENMDEMYVTSAFREQFGDETGGATPPGSVFRVTGLGVRGRPDYVYQDTH
ncbi:regucalcin-like [Mizuhopecten yessoensis]|uniref:Regucalcin n=1 Tax=Mizuhopecten yessoensis TaxID=6573 RepID=A0A210R1E2_MIZYE|nr:regucalcin-like [Mizuhopecten yessoensis]OWF54764.1 Regucalcin [Mizuhopecten yessoensis]